MPLTQIQTHLNFPKPRAGRLSKMATLTLLLCCGMANISWADEFDKADVARWQAQFDAVAAEGRRLWTSPEIGTNGVVCAQCHPNAANTHPETYPKFQQQIGRVVAIWEMFNWCLQHPLEGEPMAADDPRMTALQAYALKERRGVELKPGNH